LSATRRYSRKESELKQPETAEPYESYGRSEQLQTPSLNLLETHGSEKIVQDPTELEANKNQIINTRNANPAAGTISYR